MKILSYLFLLIITLFLIECSQRDNTSKIKIGMTYNEVETILEKPTSITRGVNGLYNDINGLPYETLKRLNVETPENKIDSTRWITPHNIKTIGELIYVTWVYDKTKTDTFYVVLNTFKEVKDTIINNTTNYYIGTRKVSQTEYNKCDGYIYRLHNNKIVDKSLYDIYKNSGLYKLPAPQKVEKRIENKKNTFVTSTEVNDSTEREYYIVGYKYCVVFDAASGRVTNNGYFPFYVSKINR